MRAFYDITKITLLESNNRKKKVFVANTTHQHK